MRSAAIVALVVAATVLCTDAFASERYDPRFRFRSIRTEHFTIHFHQGEEQLAQRLAAIAEETHVALARGLLAEGPRHTHVILVDQHDEANGWATPLPFNTIEITAAAPGPLSMIGHTDDWLRLVFTHEYTHIIHLDRSRGVFGALRHVFGRAPVLFPNLFLPGWDVEGLATFVETEAIGAGRLRSGGFRVIVDAAARAGRFDPMDRATGPLVDWPGGHAAYAYGATFHEYLAQRFGPESFGRLANATAGRVPYLPGGGYRRVFGATGAELWAEFKKAHDSKVDFPGDLPRTTAEGRRLTTQGFVAAGPRWLNDGSLVYTARTPHDFPSLARIPADGGVPTRVATRYLGERAAVRGDLVYFDQRELSRSVALQGDLFALDLRSGDVKRLTHGMRASDPDVSPDGTSVTAVRQEHGATALVRFPLTQAAGRASVGNPEILITEPEAHFGGPRWSPDGTRIAAERRRLGAVPHVVIVDAAARAITQRVITESGRLGEPEWIDDDRLIVTWEEPTRAPVLCEIQVSTGEVHLIPGPPNGARAAAFSRLTGRLAYVGYTTDGYDIYTMDGVTRAGRITQVQVVAGDSEIRRPDIPTLVSTPYRPTSAIPRFWMPVLQTDEDRIEAGAGTVGLDALGRHAYAATVRWSDRARPDWDASYAYDRWRPTFFFSAADDVTVWQDEDYRETSVDAGFTLPFRTVRRRQVWFGAFHATRETDPRSAFDRRSLRAAYQLSTTRRYGYSISPEEGVVFGGTSEVTRRALGADADAATASIDMRAYPRLGGRHRILAIRAAGAASWGETEGRRVLGAGGSAAPGSTIAFGRDAVGLARGFPSDAIIGYRAAVVNVDVRLPVATIERGLGSFPIFVRQVHAAGFVDAANAWIDRFVTDDTRVSAGFELSADVVLGHYLPMTLTSGVAWRRDQSGVHDGVAAFARVGYAF